jgi:hypothetical protein
MLAPEPHRTTRQPAVDRSTEPAICVSRTRAHVCVLCAALALAAVILCGRLGACADQLKLGAVVVSALSWL